MIEIQRIQTFLCAAESLSLSEAAKQLHLTQPAISYQIKSLEQELGVKLFFRTNMGLKLTEDGELLLPWARRLLHDMDDLKEMMSPIEGEFNGELRIMCSTSAGRYVLPKLAARFCLRYPKIKVRILSCMPENLAIRLLEGETDLGVVGREIDDKGLEFQQFFTDTIHLVVPAGHPWANKKSIEPAEVVREPLILREESSGTRWITLAELSKFDISLEDLNVFLEIGNPEGILEAIAAGYGISFISDMATRHLRNLGKIAIVPIEGVDIQRTIYMVRKRISSPHRPRDVLWSFIHAPENRDLLQGL